MMGKQWDGRLELSRDGCGRDCPEEVASGLKSLWKEGPSHVKTQVVSSIGKGKSRCQGPEVGTSLAKVKEHKQDWCDEKEGRHAIE